MKHSKIPNNYIFFRFIPNKSKNNDRSSNSLHAFVEKNIGIFILQSLRPSPVMIGQSIRARLVMMGQSCTFILYIYIDSNNNANSFGKLICLHPVVPML